MSIQPTTTNSADNKRNPSLDVLRALRRLAKSGATLVAITALCVSMLTAGAMALSASLFSLVSSAIEAVYDGRTVRKAQAMKLADLDAKAVDIEQKLADSERKRADSNLKLRAQTAELDKLKADQFVTFKGEKRALKEVVSETTSTVSKIAGKTAIANVGTMPAEGVPVLGVAAIVAATTFEVASLCDISNEMYELDVAMNPGNAITDHKEACGIPVPTKEELVSMIKSSPGFVRDTAVGFYEDLPSFKEASAWLPTKEGMIETLWSVPEGVQDTVVDLWYGSAGEEESATTAPTP
jgi:hypothetical protein